MALGRVKVWVQEKLFANDLNGEFNNILTNPISLISPTTGAINFNGQAHTGLLPSAISATSGSTGQPFAVLQSGSVGFLNVGAGPSRVSGLQGTLSSQSGSFSADGYQMRTSSSLTWMVSATSAFSASVGTAGPAAGGRDKAAAFSSTEVHWYAITTGPGSTAPAGLVSSQAPPSGPVLPAGYSGWAYLGASPYTSASTTITAAQFFRGNRAHFEAGQGILPGGSAIIETAVTYSSLVPANAGSVQVWAAQNVGAAVSVTAHIRLSPALDYITLTAGPTAGSWDTNTILIPAVNRNVRYIQDSNQGTLFLNILSYTMPNGDV